MPVPERRIAPRFNLRIPLSFNRTKPLSESWEHGRAINVSATGVSFTTALPMSVGEVISVRLEIPKRVSGQVAIGRRFTARVTHIKALDAADGQSQIGVQLLYYESAVVHDSYAAGIEENCLVLE